MSLRASLAVVLLLARFASPLSAEEPLTLDQAVTRALTQNPRLAAAESAITESQQRRASAHAGFLPRVVLAESWQRGNGPVFAFSSLLSSRQFTAANLSLDALNRPEPTSWFRASLGLDYAVWDGGRRQSSVRAADLHITTAEAERDELRARIALETTRAFGRIISADAAARAARAAQAAAKEDLARAQHRRDLGVASDADVLAVAVHLADLEQRGIQAAGDAGVARAELNRWMGSPVEVVFDVADPMPDATVVTSAVSSLLAEADERRPELRRALLQEQLADAGRQQARAALVPTVSTQVFTDFNGTRFADRASAWLAGAEVRWTFSLGGAETAALKAETARMTRAHAEAEDARASVHVEVLAAYRRLESARARLLAGQAAADEAREQQRIVRDRFDAGLAGVNDVLQASASVLSADANRTAAMVDAIVGRAELDRAVGRISN